MGYGNVTAGAGLSFWWKGLKESANVKHSFTGQPPGPLVLLGVARAAVMIYR